MAGAQRARRAFAKALAQLVLSPDTIVMYAQSVLERPELLPGAGRASALELWLGVLERAEAEQAVGALVAAVLDDHPGADALRAAFRAWQAATSEAAQWTPAPPESSRAAERVNWSERVRWLLLIAGALLLAALLVHQQRGVPASPSETTGALRGSSSAPEGVR